MSISHDPPSGLTAAELQSTQNLPDHYRAVRQFSEALCRPLQVEDFGVQSMPDASPTRWHLAHTTWFFETFVLARWENGYAPLNAAFEHLFNSYYNAVGEPFPRARRGLLTRPTVAEVFDYRREVDGRVAKLLGEFNGSAAEAAELRGVVELGLHHEQQHQELMLTDLKHAFSCNPLYPAYATGRLDSKRSEYKPEAQAKDTRSPRDSFACASGLCGPSTPGPAGWIGFDEGLIEIGYTGSGFSYDNERPRHRTFLERFELASRMVTNGEYLEFVKAGGYDQPEHWLSLGWAAAREQCWRQPLYWIERNEQWHEFTLAGLRPLVLEEPVCHVSYFEADAFARWRGARLPTEAEWEHAAATTAMEGSFVEAERFHPAPAQSRSTAVLEQLHGELWQWTSSPYTAYPGYRPPPGALGEYNGKFMCNQYVLRGGSCATSRTHIRPSYRNFFPPEARWQFAGVRLAR